MIPERTKPGASIRGEYQGNRLDQTASKRRLRLKAVALLHYVGNAQRM